MMQSHLCKSITRPGTAKNRNTKSTGQFLTTETDESKRMLFGVDRRPHEAIKSYKKTKMASFTKEMLPSKSGHVNCSNGLGGTETMVNKDLF